MTPPFRSTAVVGAGAVGSFFGAMLARAGHPVTLIGRAAARRRRSSAHGLRLEHGRAHRGRSASRASVDLAAVRGADLVLFCVKSTDTEAVARPIAPHLDDDALVLSLQNGVENAATIARARAPGRSCPPSSTSRRRCPSRAWSEHHGRGDLVIGALDAKAAQPIVALAQRLQALVELFATAGVPVTHLARRHGRAVVEADGQLRLQRDLGLAQAPYGALAALPSVRELQRGGRARGRRGGRGRGRRSAAARRRSRRWSGSPRRCRHSSRRPRRTWRAASRARSII